MQEPVRPASSGVPDALHAKVDRFVQPLIDNGIAFGLCIGLVDGDKTYVLSYGRVSAEKPGKPDADTLYEIGSITKTFTGILLAEAVERHEVLLTDPVAKYLPDSVKVPQFQGTPITLLDLATQSSALPGLPGNFAPKDPNNPFADYSADKLYAFLNDYHLTRKPGERYEYSNLGMGLLGFALARHAGMSYEALVKRRILDPLGMQSTVITFTSESRAHLAPGHDADGDPVSNWDLNALQGAGALRSSVHDMLLFLKANLGQTQTPLQSALFLAQKSQRPIEGPGSIGLAWHILPDGKTTWHNGRTGGYCSLAAFDREKQKGVVVLCNSIANEVDILGFGLLRMLEGTDPKPIKIKPVAQIDPNLLAKYVGEYELAPGAVLTLTRNNDRLMAQLTGQGAYRIYPSSETEFFYRVVDAQITFVKNEKGEVEKLVLHQNGRDLPAKKIK